MKKKILIKTLLLTGTIFLSNNIYTQICPTGILSCWKLDETAGLVLTDNTGGLNATSNTELTLDEDSKIGLSKYFNYSNYATVASNTAYNFAGNSSFSVVYWMKYTEIDYGGQDHVIISRGNYSGGNPSTTFWSSGVNVYGKANFLLSDANGIFETLESPTSYNDGLWHQVAFVREDTSQKNILYIDGIKVDEKTVNYIGNFNSDDDVLFGTLKNPSNPGYFYKGSLDEIAIFNRALSVSEIISQINSSNLRVGLCEGLNPIIFSLPKIKASVGEKYSYQLRTGGSQTSLEYSLLTKPEGMTINSTSGVIEWSPTSTNVDGYVEVCANNGIVPMDTQRFRIFISEGHAIPDDLVVLLNLDETSGPTYFDFFGLHNAIAEVEPTATTGKINGGQTFNSTTKLNIPDNGSEFDWPATASFSFECWMKTESTEHGLVCLGRNRTDYEHVASWLLGEIEGKAFFELVDNGGTKVVIYGDSIVNDNQWHQLIGVRNGLTDENLLYVDGILVASQVVVYNQSFEAPDSLAISVGYMTRLEGDPEYPFIGDLDEIAIFNRAISASEIAAFYNGGNPVGHCVNGNYYPVFTSTPKLIASESDVYTYEISFDDIDASDVIGISAVTKPDWLNLNFTPGQKKALLTGVPTQKNKGEEVVILRITDENVEVDQKFSIIVESSPTGMTLLKNSDIRVYPIPANKYIMIELGNNAETTQMELINVSGSVVKTVVISSLESNFRLDISSIETGMYCLHIKNSSVDTIGRVVIIK